MAERDGIKKINGAIGHTNLCTLSGNVRNLFFQHE